MDAGPGELGSVLSALVPDFYSTSGSTPKLVNVHAGVEFDPPRQSACSSISMQKCPLYGAVSMKLTFRVSTTFYRRIPGTSGLRYKLLSRTFLPMLMFHLPPVTLHIQEGMLVSQALSSTSRWITSFSVQETSAGAGSRCAATSTPVFLTYYRGIPHLLPRT